jgi:hypothetical protein
VLHRASRGVHIVILFSWACRKETMILPLFQECSRVGLKMTPASREERTVRALWLRIDNGWNYKENIAMSKANGRKVRESEGRALGSQPKVGLEGGVAQKEQGSWPSLGLDGQSMGGWHWGHNICTEGLEESARDTSGGIFGTSSYIATSAI